LRRSRVATADLRTDAKGGARRQETLGALPVGSRATRCAWLWEDAGVTEVLGLPGTRRGWGRGIPASKPAPCLRWAVSAAMRCVWVSENLRRSHRGAGTPVYEEGVGRGYPRLHA
jgi:hypothetical protein